MSDPTSLPNFPPPAGEHPLRGRVLDVLADLQLQPNIDDDGDVSFVANEQQLFIRCTEGEVNLLRTFGQWRLAEPVPEDTLARLNACNDVNLSMNFVKTGIANETLVATTEQLVRTGEDLRQVVEVSIGVVLAAVQLWHQRVLGLEDGDEGGVAGDES